MIAWLNRLLRGEPTPPTPPKFVAWYRGPRSERIEYIREYQAGNFFQEYWSAGRESVVSIEDATRYDTEEEAQAVVPVYDGSSGIELRSGVLKVRG